MPRQYQDTNINDPRFIREESGAGTIALNADDGLIIITAGAPTVELPDARTVPGLEVFIKTIPGTGTVAAILGQLIDAAVTFTFTTPQQALFVKSSDGGWRIISDGLGGGLALTRQNVYDNQGVIAVNLTTSATLDLETAGIVWSIRDDLQASLFAIAEGSAGGTSAITLGGAVDLFDVNALVNDFDQGVTMGSGLASSIDVAVVSGLIEASGSLTMESNAADNSMITTGGGNVVLNSSANVDIDAATTLALATANAADASGNDVTVTAGNSTAGNAQGGGISINTGDGFGTGSGGDFTLNMGTDGGGAPGVPGLVDIVSPADEDQATLRLSPSGTNAEVVSFYSGSSNPNGIITATRGSLFLQDNGATGQAWINTDDLTTWERFQTGAGDTPLSEAITLEGAANFQATNSISWGNPDGQSVDFTGPGGAGDTILEINALAAGDTVVVNGGLTATGEAGAPGQTMAITAGAGAAATNLGGQVTLVGGAGNTTGAGGLVSLTGGAGGATGVGGGVALTGGGGGATSGGGGGVAIVGGTPVDGDGGAITLTGSAAVGPDRNGGAITATAGNATGTGVGGFISLTAGSGGVTGAPGSVLITSGAGGSTSGNSGSVVIASGVPVDGDGGSIFITGADGVGTNRSGGAVTITAGSATGAAIGSNIILTSGVGAVNGFVTIDVANDDDEHLFELDNSAGTNGSVSQMLVGARDPSAAAIAARPGSLYFRNRLAVGAGELWLNTSTSAAEAATWEQVVSGAIAADTWSATLVAGAASGGRSPIISSGDDIIGVDSAVASGTGYTIRGGAHTGAAAGVFNGGDLIVAGGASDAANNGSEGGDVTITGGEYTGVGGGVSRGGNVAITGGDADTGGGASDGGAVTVDGGTGQDVGGAVTITAGRGTTAGGANAALIGGRGATDGGNVNITGGLTDGGNAADDGGTVNITAGDGTAAPFNTGNINITVPAAAPASDISGGSITISAGNTGTRNAPGGDVDISAGDSAGGGANRAGEITLTAGDQTGAAGGAGGSVTVTLGDSTNDVPGVFVVTGPTTQTEELVTLTTTGTGGDSAQLFVGGVDPSAGGGVNAPVGSFFYRDSGNAGTTGEWFGKTGSANTAWEQFVTGSAGTTSLSTAITTEGSGNFQAANSTSWGNPDNQSVDFTGPGGAGDTILEVNALAAGDTVVVNGGLTVTGDTGAPGQTHTLTGGAGAAATNAGGQITLVGGAGNTTGAGGLVSLTGGAGGATGTGGGATLAAGAGGGTSGNGGNVTITGGSATDGDGGNVLVASGDGTGTNRNGGTLSASSGDATGSGTGGALAITAGDGGVTGAAGTVAITSGDGGSASGASGAMTLSTGVVTAGDGGTITLDAANSAGATTDGGDVVLDAGDSVGNDGGLVIVRPGDSAGGDAGFLFLDTPNDDDEHIVQLTTGGTNGTTTQLLTGTRDPDTLINAFPGSLYLRRIVAATGSGLFVNVSNAAGEGTDWDEVFTSSSRTFVQGTSDGTVAVNNDISDQAPASNVTMDFGVFPTFPSTQAAFNTQTKIYINGLLAPNATDAVRSGTQATAFQLATTALIATDVIVVEQWPD